MKKALYPLFVVANILDFVTTFIGYKYFGTHTNEVNPVAWLFIRKKNWRGLACAKGVGMLLAVGSYSQALHNAKSEKEGRATSQLFVAITSLLWLMVLSNVRILYKQWRQKKTNKGQP